MRVVRNICAHTLKEHDELRTFACNREEGREGKRVHAALVDALLHLVLDVLVPVLRFRLREHPVAHIEEDNDREEHRDTLENLLSGTGLCVAEARRNPVENHCEHHAEQHAEARADVDRSQILPAVCLNKIGDNRGNDQNGLKALSERKAKHRKEGLPGRPAATRPAGTVCRSGAPVSLRRGFAAIQGNRILRQHGL